MKLPRKQDSSVDTSTLPLTSIKLGVQNVYRPTRSESVRIDPLRTHSRKITTSFFKTSFVQQEEESRVKKIFFFF